MCPGALATEAGGEANVEVPGDAAAVQQIAVDWVTGTWRESGDTRWAVAALARLGGTGPEFDLGLFIAWTMSGTAAGAPSTGSLGRSQELDR